jgi:hypothetical protein
MLEFIRARRQSMQGKMTRRQHLQDHAAFQTDDLTVLNGRQGISRTDVLAGCELFRLLHRLKRLKDREGYHLK